MCMIVWAFTEFVSYLVFFAPSQFLFRFTVICNSGFMRPRARLKYRILHIVSCNCVIISCSRMVDGIWTGVHDRPLALNRMLQTWISRPAAGLFMTVKNFSFLGVDDELQRSDMVLWCYAGRSSKTALSFMTEYAAKKFTSMTAFLRWQNRVCNSGIVDNRVKDTVLLF